MPTNIAFDPTGGMWTTSGAGAPSPGDGVWFTRRAGAKPVHVIRGLHTALGLTWFRGVLYVTSVRTPRFGQVHAFSGFTGTSFRERRRVLAQLPIGRHTVDSIVPGPDGRLYLGIGSEFDARASSRKLAGTIVSFPPSGRGLRVEAEGLRNPYGLAFVGATSYLLVTDHGRDDLGAFRPADELNGFDAAAPAPDFGFPGCSDFAATRPACRGTRAPLARLPAHAAASGLALAEDWRGQGRTAFVAQFGSSFPANPTGSDVWQVRLRSAGDGRFTAFGKRLFARGFDRNDPLGAAMGPDGALYVTQFISGSVLRFSPAG